VICRNTQVFQCTARARRLFFVAERPAWIGQQFFFSSMKSLTPTMSANTDCSQCQGSCLPRMSKHHRGM
jgi:hypothetical protein